MSATQTLAVYTHFSIYNIYLVVSQWVFSTQLSDKDN